MTTFNELRSAIWNNTPLIWNDPDPIEGNDYTITSIASTDGYTDENDKLIPILIQYGGSSEAEVFLHEILKK